MLKTCDCWGIYCEHNPLDMKVRKLPIRMRLRIAWMILVGKKVILEKKVLL